MSFRHEIILFARLYIHNVKVCTRLIVSYLTVAQLVVVLVSHVDLERVHTCKKKKKKGYNIKKKM